MAVLCSHALPVIVGSFPDRRFVTVLNGRAALRVLLPHRWALARRAAQRRR